MYVRLSQGSDRAPSSLERVGERGANQRICFATNSTKNFEARNVLFLANALLGRNESGEARYEVYLCPIDTLFLKVAAVWGKY